MESLEATRRILPSATGRRMGGDAERDAWFVGGRAPITETFMSFDEAIEMVKKVQSVSVFVNGGNRALEIPSEQVVLWFEDLKQLGDSVKAGLDGEDGELVIGEEFSDRIVIRNPPAAG